MTTQKTDAQTETRELLEFNKLLNTVVPSGHKVLQFISPAVAEKIRQALSAKQPEAVTVDWLVEMDYMEKYNAEELLKVFPNGLIIKGE